MSTDGQGGYDFEYEAMLAEWLGLALLVVMDLMRPDERIAFVLHDAFGVSFTDIAPMLNGTVASVRRSCWDAPKARKRH